MLEPHIGLATPAHAGAMAAIYAPYCAANSAVSFETQAPSTEQMAERVERVSLLFPWLVAQEGTEVLGYAYGGPHRERAAYKWCVEVAIYVAQAARGRKVASALYGALFELLGRQGFVNAYAVVALPNDASTRLHAALGFAPLCVHRGVGYKGGTWRDVAWFVRTLGERRDPPPDPVPLLLALPAVEREAILAEHARGIVAARG